MSTITILSDNVVRQSRPMGLRGEHGFAAVVDGVLFDTGQTGIAYRNAQLLGVDLDFEAIVLSHGHYDHTGGLRRFLDGEIPVYAHPDVFSTRYHEGDLISIPYSKEWVAEHASLVEHFGPVEVVPGVHALGEIPRTHPDNPTGEIEAKDGRRREDRVYDDQALAIETGDGIALLCGCCHAGLRNTVEHAEEVTGEKVTAIVGGTHLKAHDRTEVEELADWLDGRLELLAPAHCTGCEAEHIIESTLPSVYRPVGVGTRVELPGSD